MDSDRLCKIPGCAHAMISTEDAGNRFCQTHIDRIERIFLARTHWNHELTSALDYAIEATTLFEERIRNA